MSADRQVVPRFKSAPKARKGRSRLRKVVYDKVRADVERRANGACEVRSRVCTGRGAECHHVLPRSAGGPDCTTNCLWACSPCHHHIHAYPDQSYRKGWLRRRG